MNALKHIITTAKKIRAARPGKSWKASVKEAGVLYRKKHPHRVGSAKTELKRLRTKVKRVKKAHAAEGRAIRKIGSVPCQKTIVYRGWVICGKRIVKYGTKKKFTWQYCLTNGNGLQASAWFHTLAAAKAWARHLSK